MNRLTIYSNGEIAIDGRPTGYGVKQTPRGTEVYVLDPGRRYDGLYRVADGEVRAVEEELETDGVNDVLVVAQSPEHAMAAAREHDEKRIAVDNVVWRGHTIAAVTAPELPPIELPNARYALSCDAPASGNPGAAQFEADFLGALAQAR